MFILHKGGVIFFLNTLLGEVPLLWYDRERMIRGQQLEEKIMRREFKEEQFINLK